MKNVLKSIGAAALFTATVIAVLAAYVAIFGDGLILR